MRAHGGDLYMELIDAVRPLAGARPLGVLKRRGHAVVLACSAKSHEVEHYLDLLDARELATAGPARPTCARSRTPTSSPAVEKAGGGVQ